MSRTIGVVTSARADVGILLPILRAMREQPALRADVLATGMHLSRRFGRTLRQIEDAGVPIRARVACLSAKDTPRAIGEAIGRGIAGFAILFGHYRPDLLLVTGDRFEMYAAAVAALPFAIPVAHLHGGELTLGAFDDALRHSMTKLSHLHFVTTNTYAARVIQLGEESWRVTVCGAPSLDNLRAAPLPDLAALERRIRLRLEPAPLLVTLHPVTLEHERTEWHIGELLAALEGIARPIVFTAPNADTHGRVIRRAVEAFVARRRDAVLVESLGTEGYFGLMARAAAMVGNSSSGLIEAPSFALPVVNIGTRQQGRLHAENVIDVGYHRDEIRAGLTQALAPSFRERLRDCRNPYGHGRAAETIVKRLVEVPLTPDLVVKRFVDRELPTVPVECA